MYAPAVGSYQRAFTGPANFDMSTVIVRIVGRYAIAKEPSEVLAVVAQLFDGMEPMPKNFQEMYKRSCDQAPMTSDLGHELPEQT